MPNLKFIWSKKAKIITHFAANVSAQMAPKLNPFENEIFSPKLKSLDNLLIKISASMVFLKQHSMGHLFMYKGILSTNWFSNSPTV